jgi:hypothetical protein
VFDALAIRQLKAEASRSLFVQSPTSIEVLAIIWRSVIVASRTGNLLWKEPVKCKAGDQIELDALVSYLSEAEGKIDSQFMAEIHGDEGIFFKVIQHLKEKRNVF